MSNQLQLLEDARSLEAKAALWRAYDALQERDKKRILRFLQEKEKEHFKYLCRHGGFPGGTLPAKIGNRELGYGKIVDKFLKSRRDGNFGKEVLMLFFSHSSHNQMGKLLVHLEGCTSADLFDDWLKSFETEHREEPFAVLAVRFMDAYGNPDYHWSKKHTVESGDPGEESSDRTETKESGLLDGLDEAINELSVLTERARMAAPWSEEEWGVAVSSVSGAVNRVRDEVARLSENAGKAVPEWGSRDGLEAVLENLRLAREQGARKQMLVCFLKGLAAQIRALKARHRLPTRRLDQEKVRDDSANEIESASGAQEITWWEDGPAQPRVWLSWAAKLDGESLQGLIEQLREMSYPKTALLVEDLDPGYEIVEETDGNQTAAAASTTPCPVDEMHSVKDAGAATPEPPSPATPANPHETNSETAADEAADTKMVAVARPEKTVGGRQGQPEPMSKADSGPKPQGDDVNRPVPEPPNESDATEPLGGSSSIHAPLGELADAAKAALTAAEAEIEPAIERVIWILLAKNELTLAHQVLSAAHQTGLTNAFPVPPSLFEILALLPAYSSVSSEVPQHIRTILQGLDVTALFKNGESQSNENRRLLVASALLRPSLFDPSSNAGAILEGVHLGHMAGFHAIQQALTEFGRKGVDLNATILSATLNVQGWRGKDAEIVERVRQFQESALARKINYAPATWIWRYWFQAKDGWLRSLFTLAASQERRSLEKLAGLLTQVDVEMEIRKGWQDSKGRGDLVGTALGALHRLANEALDLLRQRLDHWNSGVQAGDDYRQKVLGNLAETILQNLPAAEHELESFIKNDQGGDERCQIAAELMRHELGHLKQALTGTLIQIDCPNVDHWLKVDLLRLSSIELDGSMQLALKTMGEEAQSTGFWGEVDPVRQRLALKLKALQRPILDWKQAFEESIARHDHRAARWILDHMARVPDVDLPALETRKANHAEEVRNRLRRDLKSVESQLVAAFSKGWLTPEVHASNMERVQQRIEGLSQRDDDGQDQPFHEWFRDLKEVTYQIDAALKQQVHAAEDALKSLTQASPNEIARVRRLLDAGDVQLANEYIQKLEVGESIDDADEVSGTNLFVSLYGDDQNAGCFDALMACLDGKSPPFDANNVINEIQNSDTWCGIALGRLDATSRGAAATALQRWFGAQKSRRIDEKNLEIILTAVGLPVSAINQEREGFVLRLSSDVFCPIPDFGSEIRSRKIRVQVDMQRSSVDDVVQQLGRMELGMAPTILLWMRPVSMQSRRKFSRLCRQKSMKVLLIDTVLAAYALTAEGARLQALFECGLPFTNVTPYTTTGGSLPEEMFFGRRREIEAIESAGPAGTCFVYGGRQIGKTVLLRRVERDFPRRGTHHVALYLDLNFHAVGQTVSMDEIWRIVADELSKKDVSIFGKTPRAQFTVEDFAHHITHWLNEDEERRILLLLDEADRFLQADSDTGNDSRGMPFRICLKLKGLMDATHRRFKVVFAGLHNVQRSTRVANNPLAQLGMPVCVGPLYQNGESREASRLVSVPLSASGVFFDSSDTINTILARTNYYPNLIQIFCSRLLAWTVDKQGRTHQDQTPPFQVTSDEVENVFMRHEIRDEIRKKFMLTLDLDRRFSLIANYMAWMAKDFPEGFTVDDIQRDAVPWWPAGFEADRQRTRDSLHEDLAVLLNEMCGLGILRRDHADRFFLRSPNVVALLGSPKDIEKVLESAATWEAPPPYSPDSFRRPTALYGQHFHWRSCLTARQETFIRDPRNAVVLISGCRAAGIDEVVHCLELALGTDYLVKLPEKASLEEFSESFATLVNREKEAGKTVVLVPASLAWDVNWVLAAKKAVGRFTAKGRPVGVVFLADAELVWAFRAQWKSILEEIGPGHMKLQRWDDSALRQWLTDSGLALDCLPAIRQATCGWHQAIRVLGSSVGQGGSLDMAGDSGLHALSLLWDSLSLKDSFGFHDDLSVDALRVLAEVAEVVTNEDLLGLCDAEISGLEEQKILATLDWAERMGIVERTDKGWCLDNLVSKLITKLYPVK